MTEVQIRPMTLADYAEVRALRLARAGIGLNLTTWTIPRRA